MSYFKDLAIDLDREGFDVPKVAAYVNKRYNASIIGFQGNSLVLMKRQSRSHLPLVTPKAQRKPRGKAVWYYAALQGEKRFKTSQVFSVPVSVV